MATPFDQAFAILLPEEGGYDTDPADPGNWTGGAIGVGRDLGTNFGIDSASYASAIKSLPPSVAVTMPATVKGLTRTLAGVVYKAAYWDKVHGDDLPPQLALLVFDAAVNNGVQRASEWLQIAVGTPPDGVLGPMTMAALAKSLTDIGLDALCIEFQARRVDFMGGITSMWPRFGLGWSRRLVSLMYQSRTMTGPSA